MRQDKDSCPKNKKRYEAQFFHRNIGFRGDRGLPGPADLDTALQQTIARAALAGGSG